MGPKAFRRLAATHTLIPVTREVFADLDTPVSAFWKLRRGRHSFLLESVEGGEKWARYTFMGTEPRAVFTARGRTLTVERPGRATETRETDDPLGAVTEHLRGETFYHDPALPRFVGGLVGFVAYDGVRWFERLPERLEAREDIPDLRFMLTRLTLVYDNLEHRAMLVYLAHVTDPEGADDAWDEAQKALAEAEARLQGPLPALPPSPSPEPVEPSVTVSDARYGEAVEAARQYIAAGDIIQVVLSRRFTQPAGGLHPFLVYRTLRGLNPSPYMFYLELGEGLTVVGASPEALVRLTGDTVETRPIAGTRPRGETGEEDRALAEALKADPKERAEHVMLVDLARNDVGRVARIGTVAVPERMIIERYSHVMHLVSHVRGTRREGVGTSDIVAATFPAGTLSGAPKIRAMEIIEELEPERRGVYGGAVGLVGAEGNLDLAIAIRTLVATGDRFDVQAGAGIVYDSVPEREAEETKSKARAVLKAIDLARHQFFAEERS